MPELESFADKTIDGVAPSLTVPNPLVVANGPTNNVTINANGNISSNEQLTLTSPSQVNINSATISPSGNLYLPGSLTIEDGSLVGVGTWIPTLDNPTNFSICSIDSYNCSFLQFGQVTIATYNIVFRTNPSGASGPGTIGIKGLPNNFGSATAASGSLSLWSITDAGGIFTVITAPNTSIPAIQFKNSSGVKVNYASEAGTATNQLIQGTIIYST